MLTTTQAARTIHLRRWSEEPREGFLHRVKTSIEYASPGTKFYVGGKDTLAIIRKAGFTIPIHVTVVEESC